MIVIDGGDDNLITIPISSNTVEYLYIEGFYGLKNVATQPGSR